MRASHENPFLVLISAGRITTQAQLKSAYRTLLMKSHPDTVGSDALLERHLSLGAFYEAAKAVLQECGGTRAEPPSPTASTDHRLAYYQSLQKLEQVDKPYSFHREQNLAVIAELKARARFHFEQWEPRRQTLYERADLDYDRLKTEKPSGPYMKNALAINVSPVFHNIVAYHLTGVAFYRTQVKQNLSAVLQKLRDHDCAALREFLELLIDDMKNGPALFAGDRAVATKTLTARGT